MNNQSYITRVIEVPKEWDNIISYFYYAKNSGTKNINRTLLPTFQTILIFSFATPATLRVTTDKAELKPFAVAHSLVLGPIKNSIKYTLPAGSEILIANFEWDAFYRFFGKSLKAIEQWIYNPDELTQSHCFSSLWEKLLELATPEAKVAAILSFASSYIRQQESAATLMLDILQKEAKDYINPVKLIAGQSGQHQRTIQMQFVKYLGFSAKEKIRYERFKHAVQLIRQMASTNAAVDWHAVVNTCGYYDQSHLIHDFNYFIDLSPTEFLKLGQEICVAGS